MSKIIQKYHKNCQIIQNFAYNIRFIRMMSSVGFEIHDLCKIVKMTLNQ